MRRHHAKSFATATTAASLCALLLPSGAARAEDVEDMAARMVELEAQIRELDLTLRSETPNAQSIERRVIDGQVLYELKNYEAASTILLDVVDRYPNDRAYPEALFYLADSLYLKRDYLSARRYFEKSVALGQYARHFQDSLERLIELSLHTGDYSNVDDYLSKLGGLHGASTPNISYVEGTYFFSRQRYDPALDRLYRIINGQPYWFQAQYFIGASRVAQNKPGEAVQVFDSLVRTAPKTDTEKRVVELAHLALGRVYYDQGRTQAAASEYKKIPQGSDLYVDALYEAAWVAIKDKQYTKAYRSLDLLLTVLPDGPQAPDVKLLMGNLQVREGQWDDATKSFTKTRDQFEDVKKDIDEAAKKQGDSETFFRELLANNLGKFDLASYVPASATKWVVKEPDIEKLSGLVGDESELRKSLEESAELLSKLEKAVEGPARVNIFPELAAARTRATATANRLIDLENRLIQKEHDLLLGTADPEERRVLEQATGARQQLQKDLSSLPRGKDSYDERIKKARADYDELDKRAVELNVLLSNLRAERIAIEKYVSDTHQTDNPTARAEFTRQLAEVQKAEDEISATSDALRKEIAEASAAVGVDDAQMQAEEELKGRLRAAQQAEQAAMASLRQRATGASRDKAAQIEILLARSRGGQETIDQSNSKIDALIDLKLGDVRTTIAEEKAHIATYQQTLSSCRGETTTVGGGVTAASFRNIADRFYQIVVRADVGIIDVAWALKQSKTDENSRLVREKKRELKMLDDEFREVLKE